MNGLFKALGFGAAYIALGLFAGPSVAGLSVQSGQPGTSPPIDYIRIVDENDGYRVGLETSARVFKPVAGDGPTIVLVGVMHIGEKAYYNALQDYLDTQGVVLFEGVKPSGAGEAAQAAPDDQAKAKLTTQRLRLLAVMLEKQKAEKGSRPKSLDDLVGALRRPVARIAQGAMVDGWGNKVQYIPEAAGKGFDLVSLGADGKEGGEGPAADLKFSDQPALTKAEVGEKQEGIQTQLAGALGLEFQLVAIDYSHPNWRNSDMSIDQVQAKLQASGASGEALFKMLDGSSMPAKLAGLVLGFIRANPTSQAMAKLLMVEVLGHADELMAQAGGAGAMMKVIVLDRNEAVFDDLKKVISSEPAVHSVALFYGAGHLPDMERRLTKEMGYTFTEDRWFRAIDMDLKALGIDPAQARVIRESISKNLKGARNRGAAKPKAKDDAPPADPAE